MGEHRGPWTLVERRPVYRNEWIAVREDKVVRLGEAKTVFGIVEAVAGGIAPGEAPEAAARRELREEAGIEAATWTGLGTIDQLTEIVLSPNHLFLARGLSFRKPEQEAGERIEDVTAPLAQAVAWVMDGTITHAATAILLLKADRYLRR